MKLEPYKFCGAPAAAARDDQIEFNSWTASIECSGCGATLTMQYIEMSPELALAAIVALWNSEPGAYQ
ncbi:hypothetical protein [Paraburkholderia tropica]|uniref:hypothetical protein n=1 Tax=Paraburkholderia tropica TaxID=92647 RepID=UPI0016173EE4|nr:hypothetical protein [Paraburkholderia tropica]MBB6320568.1 hypothetical protein [Paraburkholderia tropica]